MATTLPLIKSAKFLEAYNFAGLSLHSSLSVDRFIKAVYLVVVSESDGQMLRFKK